jgi:hypothetical protein
MSMSSTWRRHSRYMVNVPCLKGYPLMIGAGNKAYLMSLYPRKGKLNQRQRRPRRRRRFPQRQLVRKKMRKKRKKRRRKSRWWRLLKTHHFMMMMMMRMIFTNNSRKRGCRNKSNTIIIKVPPKFKEAIKDHL